MVCPRRRPDGFSFLLIAFAAGAYPEYPRRDIQFLNPWVRTFQNGSSSEVQLPDFFMEREVVDYSLVLGVPLTRRALLRFTCSLRCVLFADGVVVSENDSPYLPMFAELPFGVQELRLSVDSCFLGRHSMHQVQYDWWQPGGVFVPVELHFLRGRAHLRHVGVYPLSFPVVRVEVEASARLRVAVGLDGNEPVIVPGDLFEFEVPNPRVWSVSSPQLHILAAYLLDEDNSIEDMLVTRFGLREVAAADGRVHLNRKPLQLLGVNRHHFGPGGVILTEDEMRMDALYIKNMGGNFVRGAHYPQDPRFLDICDEEGLLVWEESLAWQNSVQELNNDTWLDMQKKQIQRMLRSSANHPSVIIYGFLNEGASDHPASVRPYRELADTVRGHDSTRLVGWASSVTTRDLAWEFADVIGFNDYTGWYPTTKPALAEDLKYVPQVWTYYHDWVVEHFPGKPLIASEFGAGGQLGRRGSSLSKWTEEFQALLVQLHLLGALQADLAGVAIWLLADMPVDPTTSQEYRPNGVNDKGLLSVDRKPKLAYGAVRAIFHGHRSLLLPDRDKRVFEDVVDDLVQQHTL